MTGHPNRRRLDAAAARKSAEEAAPRRGANPPGEVSNVDRAKRTFLTRRAGTEPLRDQVVVVTGGGRGIGRVFAQSLAAAGAIVAVMGRSPNDLAGTVADISAAGGQVTSVIVDVIDRRAVDAGISQIEQKFGRIDLLINNAGVWGPIANLWDADPGEWWRTMEVHIGGAFLCSRAVLPGMISRNSGRIINIVSNAGVFRWPTCSAYSVSKAAVVKLTENLGAELRLHRVTVFAFHPGLLPIGLSAKAIGMEAEPGSPAGRAIEWVRSEIAADRAVSPKRAADFITALAMGQGDLLSGRYLTVFDDLPALAARAEAIQSADSLTLRLREL
ncbi:SDR family NAD(P)-dependent oxidoreductase [Bradyrhizobium cenepequi]